MDKKLIFAIIISAAVLIAAGLFLSPSTTTNKNRIYLMLTDPVYYANEFVFQNISEEEKKEIDFGMEDEFRSRCSPWTDQCNETFLSNYLRVKILSGSESPIPSGMDASFEEAHHKVRDKFENGTDQRDIKNCIITYIRELCQINYLNWSERDYWAQKILDATGGYDSSFSYAQARYFTECMNITNISQKPSVGEKVCTPSPLFIPDISAPCKIYNYLYVKRFCGYHITDDEISFADDVVNFKDLRIRHRLCQLYLAGNMDSFRSLAFSGV